jgi:hypothetical protein
MTRQVGNEIDEFVTDAVRNTLLGLPLDLAAINIARGRDTGVPTLNEARREFYHDDLGRRQRAQAVHQLARPDAEPQARGFGRQLHRRLRHARGADARTSTPSRRSGRSRSPWCSAAAR